MRVEQMASPWKEEEAAVAAAKSSRHSDWPIPQMA
jgi:hypothetical protein